jgi:hypothetical protein
MNNTAASQFRSGCATDRSAGSRPIDYRANEFDRKRIERAIAGRKRYRYVSPSVHQIGGGYIVRSPCCSRKVESHGGVVDIALLLYAKAPQPWRLSRKDHERQQWQLHTLYERLSDLLDYLNADPTRQLWQ